MSGFNVSAIITAVDNLTAPMRAMTATVNRFSDNIHSEFSRINNSFRRTRSEAAQTSTQLSRLNNIHFNGLIRNLNSVQHKISSTSQALHNIGNASMTAGMAGIGAGYAMSQTLDPVRETQRLRSYLGVLYKPHGSLEQIKAEGKYQVEYTQNMFSKLPGDALVGAEARGMLKNAGLEGDYKRMHGFIAGAMGAGKKFDNQYLENMMSASLGNDADYIKKIGFKMANEDGRVKVLALNKENEQYLPKGTVNKNGMMEMAFKDSKGFFDWYTKMAEMRFGKMVDDYQLSTEGRESTFGDVIKKGTNDTWEQSGMLKVYNDQVSIFTDKISKLVPVLSNMLKPYANWLDTHKELTSKLIIGVPALLLFGVGINILGYAVSGLLLPIKLATAALKVLRAVAGSKIALNVANVATKAGLFGALLFGGYELATHMSSVNKFLKELNTKIKSFFEDLTKGTYNADISKFFSEIFDSLAKNLPSFIKNIGNIVISLGVGVWSVLQKFVGTGIQNIYESFSKTEIDLPEILNNLLSVLKGLAEGALKIIDSWIVTIGEYTIEFFDLGASLGGKLVDGIKDSISKLDIIGFLKDVTGYSTAVTAVDNYFHGEPPKGYSKEAAGIMARTYEQLGYTRPAIAGLLGNAQVESNFNPFASNDIDGGHYGIYQWSKARQKDYTKLFGHTMQSVTDWGTALKEQIKFSHWELNHTYKKAGQHLQDAANGYQGAIIASNEYERPFKKGDWATQVKAARYRAPKGDYFDDNFETIRNTPLTAKPKHPPIHIVVNNDTTTHVDGNGNVTKTVTKTTSSNADSVKTNNRAQSKKTKAYGVH